MHYETEEESLHEEPAGVQEPEPEEELSEETFQPAPPAKPAKSFDWKGVYAVCKDCKYSLADTCGKPADGTPEAACRNPYMIDVYRKKVPYHERLPASMSHILISQRMVESCPEYKSKLGLSTQQPQPGSPQA